VLGLEDRKPGGGCWSSVTGGVKEEGEEDERA
jgi:hypothetical protein